MTFEVLPPRTPQQRAAAAAALAEGVAQGNSDSIRVAVVQSRGSSDAVAVALQQMMIDKGSSIRSAQTGLPYEERRRRYEQWERDNGYARVRVQADGWTL